MDAGFVWVSGVDNLLHYTDESGPTHRVVAGGLTCDVDCSGHDQAEDAEVNSSAEGSNQSGAQVLYQVTNNNLENGIDYTDPHNTYDYGGQVSGYTTGNGSYCGGECVDNGSYCPGAQDTYWLVV